MTRLFLPILLLLALIGLAAPQPAQAADRGKLEAFLKVTGFDVSLESIGLSAEAAPRMLGLESSDFGSGWSRLSAQVFDTQDMHDMALDLLEDTLSDPLLDHAAGFYASELGQRLVAEENRSHMVEDDAAKREEGERLLKEGSEARRALLEGLNAAVDGDGHAVRATQEIQVRFIMAASNAGVLANPVDEGALRAALREDEEGLREVLRASALAGAAYTYQSFTDDQIAAYRDALAHPKMQEVYQLMNAIQHEIMADRFETLAARMAGLTGGQDL